MILVFLLLNWPFPVTQLGKNLPAVRETWVKSLNWEDPLEKGKTKSIYSWLCISRLKYNTVAVQLLSRVRLFAAPQTAIRQASLYFTISESSLTLISIGLMMPSNHLILSCPLLLLSVFSSFRVFSNESAFCIRWPKYWRFSISISPSSEYSGLISFSVDWFDLPAIQGTLKSLFWNHTSKSSVLQHSAFFMVQRSHLYMTAGKTIALTIPTFVILAK